MKNLKIKRNPKHYRTGFDDNLKPRALIDLSKAKDIDDLLHQMSRSAFGAKQFGQATDVACNMFTDPNTFVVLTLSGAMTPAGMGLLICEMIDRGFVQAIVSTGALMTHGLVESSGRTHFQHNPVMDDLTLFKKGYNRIYDVVELEKNLDDAEAIVYKVLDQLPQNKNLSSRLILELLGRWLTKNTTGKGILKSAYQKNIPVYIPAFTDSELGLDVALYNRRRVIENKKPFQFNPFIDLEHFAELLNQQKRAGIFTIGGGVPRNWAQQVAPYLELIQNRMPKGKVPSHIKGIRYSYAVRICPDAVQWGGLSGCTYEEGKSWGKFDPDCQYAEVIADATMVWPLIIQAIIQRLRKKRITRVKKNFNIKSQLKKVDYLVEKYRLPV